MVYSPPANLYSYKDLNTNVFFAYLFAIFEILSEPHSFDF